MSGVQYKTADGEVRTARAHLTIVADGMYSQFRCAWGITTAGLGVGGRCAPMIVAVGLCSQFRCDGWARMAYSRLYHASS